MWDRQVAGSMHNASQKGDAMHEMSILSNVMDVVLKYAQEESAHEVVSVTLVVGELRDVIDELMESCFQFLARDTIAANASLIMEKVPLKAQCECCKLVFPASIKQPESLVCPDCASTQLRIYSGKEFLIKSIEIA